MFYYATVVGFCYYIDTAADALALSTESCRCSHSYAHRYSEVQNTIAVAAHSYSIAFLVFSSIRCHLLYLSLFPPTARTVYTDELLLHPVTELEKLLTFAGYKANREQLLSAVHTHLPALQQHWSDQYIIQSLYNNNTISGSSTSSTSSINSVHTNTINTILNKAIIAVQKEMKETLNLTKWPCRSFRDLYTEKPREPLHLPLSIGNLIADCKGSYVKCSIRYDIEEYKRTQQH